MEECTNEYTENGLVTETHRQILTVCDKCNELLKHKILYGTKSTEIRVEACPECSAKSDKDSIFIKLTKDQCELMLKILKKESQCAIEKETFRDYADFADITDTIKRGIKGL